MDTRTRGVLHRFSGAINVELAGTRQSANHRLLDALGDLGNGVKVALRGDREARLDDIHPHRLEEIGHLQFFLEGHGGAGALLPITERRIENEDAVGIGDLRVAAAHIGMGPAWLLLRHVCHPWLLVPRVENRVSAGDASIRVSFDPLSARP